MNSIKIEGWAKIKIAFRYNERERGGPFACFPANLERLSVDGGSTVALPPPFFFFSSFKIIAQQMFEITFRSINIQNQFPSNIEQRFAYFNLRKCLRSEQMELFLKILHSIRKIHSMINFWQQTFEASYILEIKNFVRKIFLFSFLFSIATRHRTNWNIYTASMPIPVCHTIKRHYFF